MRGFRKVFASVVFLIVGIIVLINFILYFLKLPENGRPYRVEINRIAMQIEQEGPESVVLS